MPNSANGAFGSVETDAPRPAQPEIRFHEILANLIEESPYRNHRRAIWEHIGVSSAALSQYVLGRSRPRFESLCLLADFFGVTLDYLVLGKEVERPISDESQSMARYVDWTLADMQARTGAQTWLLTRVGQAIVQRMDEITKEVLPDTTQSGGVLNDNEMVRLEKFSRQCKLMTPNLHHDLLKLDNQIVAGRFARVAAENINNGCSYQYLLPLDVSTSWESVVQTYRKLLSEMGLTKEKLKQAKFLTTDAKFFTGCYLYRLDRARFAREDPLFYEVLKPHMSEDNWIGFTRHQHSEILSGPGLLYEINGLQLSLSAFDELWKNGNDL